MPEFILGVVIGIIVTVGGALSFVVWAMKTDEDEIDEELGDW